MLKKISFIMPKGDPGSLDTLKTYIYDHTGMGDFLIHDRNGAELYRITDIKGMVSVLLKAEKENAEAYELRELLGECGQKDCFSTWLYMHGYRDLANRLLPEHALGVPLVRLLIDELRSEIQKIKYTPLVIGKMKVWNLKDLLRVFRTFDPVRIQKYSDNDLFSTWLDFKGYPELAEEIRPIHSKGAKLEKILHDIVKKWIGVYRNRNGKR